MSVSHNESVDNSFIIKFVAARGQKMKELVVANFILLWPAMQVHLGDTPNNLTEGDFEALARKTEGFSSFDIAVYVKDVLFEPVISACAHS
ncbi:hypothetical protein CTI12_AA530260 [Artemisia annua]|uniref:Uncharacterized protein n=1 Tax=Artemisia annua TaxID=35608 RepID=A0A2U1L4F5_ARTAN|nr:hypothetical protein CTI12_AA530260 [Artemisia annua]